PRGFGGDPPRHRRRGRSHCEWLDQSSARIGLASLQERSAAPGCRGYRCQKRTGGMDDGAADVLSRLTRTNEVAPTEVRKTLTTIDNYVKPSVRRARARSVGGMAFTELWERFSFYGLQSILAFYLLYELDKGGLALGSAESAGIVGAYGGAVYIAQLVGAWLGERVLSPKNLVLIGGIVIALGHICLAVVPGLAGLSVGLVLIILGTGALKTNITSIVGFVLENETDARRDAGFSYFYMAINTGAVLGPLATGFVQESWGFHPGFALAAIGMIAALVHFVLIAESSRASRSDHSPSLTLWCT